MCNITIKYFALHNISSFILPTFSIFSFFPSFLLHNLYYPLFLLPLPVLFLFRCFSVSSLFSYFSFFGLYLKIQHKQIWLLKQFIFWMSWENQVVVSVSAQWMQSLKQLTCSSWSVFYLGRRSIKLSSKYCHLVNEQHHVWYHCLVTSSSKSMQTRWNQSSK